MSDEVQEQMGDILSAFGIPELAKDIYAIPMETIEPEGQAGEAKAVEGEEGEKGEGARESKSPADEAMEEGSSVTKEDVDASQGKNDGEVIKLISWF